MSAEPRWDETASAPRRPVAATTRGATAESDPNAARIVTAIALASIAVGAIHLTVAATIGGDAQTNAFFGLVGAAEILFGLVALVGAPRWWLALGALGHAVVVATWVVSRTVGLPVGQFAHVVLPVGFADVLATILGAVVVVGAAVLVIQGSGATRAAARVRGFALAAAVVFGALALAGVVSAANAFGSSGGGGNAPTAPSGGNGVGGGYGGGTGGGYGGTGGGGGSGGGYGY